MKLGIKLFVSVACAALLLIVCCACRDASGPDQTDERESPATASGGLNGASSAGDNDDADGLQPGATGAQPGATGAQPGATGAQPGATGAQPGPDAADGSVLSGGILLPNGLLPEGGRELLPPPERFYENTVLELIPFDGYGRVWPYIGGYVNSYMGIWSGIIGVCDDAGRIICDPAYNSAELIENGAHTLYAFTKYGVNRTGRYGDMYVTTIAAVDGSWAEPFERALWEEASSYEYTPPIESWYGLSRGYLWRDVVKYDYITAKRDGLWGVIGWDGAVLLPFVYLEPVCFHDGLASVLSENGETFRYIDIEGNTVLGPYEAPPRPRMEYGLQGFDLSDTPITYKLMFYDGYAKFYKDGKFGIVDRSGNIVIPAEYDFITCMNGGLAMFVAYFDGDSEQSVYERYGVVNSAGSVIVSPMDYNYRYYQTPEFLDGCALIMQSNNPEGDLISYDGTRTTYEANFPYYTADRYLAFHDSNVRFSMDLYSFDYINSNLIHGCLVIVFDRDDQTWSIYDEGGNAVTPKNPGSSLFRTMGWRETEYLLIGVSAPGVRVWPPPVMIYDLQGRALLDEAYDVIMPVGDRFMVRGRYSAGLVDADGNYVIEVDVTAYRTD